MDFCDIGNLIKSTEFVFSDNFILCILTTVDDYRFIEELKISDTTPMDVDRLKSRARLKAQSELYKLEKYRELTMNREVAKKAD